MPLPVLPQSHSLSDACRLAIQRYQNADLELSMREDQLDFLLRCSRAVCARKMDLALAHAETPVECEGTPPEVSSQAIEDYLRLIDRSKTLDKEITILKEKCSEARSTCSWLYMHLKQFPEFQNQKLRDNVTLTRIRTLDNDGMVDKQTAVNRLYDITNVVANVGATVGGLGAGVTFTTIFSATRGRLDLMAWAFTCFLSVVFFCTTYQTSARSRRIFTSVLTYFPISTAPKLFIYPLWVGVAFPLAVGLGLLAVAIGLLGDPSQPIVTGSRAATSVAGYITLGWILVLLLISGLNVWELPVLFSKNRELVPLPVGTMTSSKITEGKLDPYPSHILPPDSKWEFLPGGSKYPVYRRWRRNHSWGSPCIIETPQNGALYRASVTSLQPLASASL